MALLGFPGYKVRPKGVKVLVCTEKPEAHRFLIKWLAFHTNPQNHNLGLPSWIPDLICPHIENSLYVTSSTLHEYQNQTPTFFKEFDQNTADELN
jgi:hypothetical protein